MSAPAFRRRNFWIDKKFQTSFAIRFSLLLVIEAALIALLFAWISSGTLTAGFKSDSGFELQSTRHFFMRDFLVISAWAMASVSTAAIIAFIVLSHRISGPVYRLEQFLAGIQSGRLEERVRLRKKDQFTNLAERMNGLADALDSEISNLKNEVTQFEKIVERVADPTSKTQLSAALARIKERVSRFQTSP